MLKLKQRRREATRSSVSKKKKTINAVESDSDMESSDEESSVEESSSEDESKPVSRKRTFSPASPSSDASSDSEDDSSSSKAKRVVKKRKRSPNSTRASHKQEVRSKTKKNDACMAEHIVPKKKWTVLKHNGPLFTPSYTKLPNNIRLIYNGKPVALNPKAEEIAGFYAVLIESAYAKNPIFNSNFFQDFRQAMTNKERSLITDLRKCNFKEIHNYFQSEREKKKTLSKTQKQTIKEEKEAQLKKYRTALVDGNEEKIQNFLVEPPGLFRGRGNHPKMGRVKFRVLPEQVTINCSDHRSSIPKPPQGHRWKEVIHDNSVSWLACWTENIQGQIKYILLDRSSTLNAQSDQLKYEKARKLETHIDRIRKAYKADLNSKKEKICQRAVALYLIDHLALRAGNDKDNNQADTVGCISLRVEHIKLVPKNNVVIFDFPGKDCIQYQNQVSVDKQVFQNLKRFTEKKAPADFLFQFLTTDYVNDYLQQFMPGLTMRVFRTYRACKTFQQRLEQLTPADGTPEEKLFAYNRANREVAVICNHKRTIPKTFQKTVEALLEKIGDRKKKIKALNKVLKRVRDNGTRDFDKVTKKVDTLKQQIEKLELKRKEKEEGKEIAIGTSKVNYLDPRVTAAWAKKFQVPIQKIYSKTQRERFRWALENTNSRFRF